MFLTPSHILEHLHLQKNATVADIGAGSGAYTLALAKLVGDEGRVYAIDVHREVLETLKHSLEKAGFMNTEMIWADIEDGVYLDSYSLDAVVMSNVLFMVDDKKKALKEVARLLAPGAELLLVDWSHSHGGVGPHQDHVIPEKKAEELLTESGFRIVERIPAGSFHYAILSVRN